VQHMTGACMLWQPARLRHDLQHWHSHCSGSHAQRLDHAATPAARSWRVPAGPPAERCKPLGLCRPVWFRHSGRYPPAQPTGPELMIAPRDDVTQLASKVRLHMGCSTAARALAVRDAATKLQAAASHALEPLWAAATQWIVSQLRLLIDEASQLLIA